MCLQSKLPIFSLATFNNCYLSLQLLHSYYKEVLLMSSLFRPSVLYCTFTFHIHCLLIQGC